MPTSNIAFIGSPQARKNYSGYEARGTQSKKIADYLEKQGVNYHHVYDVDLVGHHKASRHGSVHPTPEGYAITYDQIKEKLFSDLNLPSKAPVANETIEWYLEYVGDTLTNAENEDEKFQDDAVLEAVKDDEDWILAQLKNQKYKDNPTAQRIKKILSKIGPTAEDVLDVKPTEEEIKNLKMFDMPEVKTLPKNQTYVIQADTGEKLIFFKTHNGSWKGRSGAPAFFNYPGFDVKNRKLLNLGIQYIPQATITVERFKEQLKKEGLEELMNLDYLIAGAMGEGIPSPGQKLLYRMGSRKYNPNHVGYTTPWSSKSYSELEKGDNEEI